MKKLVVMLGVVCVALLSQAASIDWALSATKSNKNYGADGTTVFGKTTGDMAYLLLASDAAALKSASEVSGKALGSQNTFNNNGGFSSFTVDAGTKLTENTSYDFATVLVQGDKFLVTSTMNATTSDADTVREVTFSYADVQASTSGWGTGGGDIPEPTSGLLLLVGAGMLALRRKQK